MAKRQPIDLIAAILRCLVAGCVALTLASGPSAAAGTAIKIGRTKIPDISHLPIYLALETGLFREEGLDARLVAMPSRALVTAGLGGIIDFVPITSAGAQAALKGAPVRFVVGQSLYTPSAFISHRDIVSAEQLKGQILGLGRKGQTNYHDSESILRDSFNLVRGDDYRVVVIPDERDRIAALQKGEISAGLFSFVYAAKAEARGFKRLLRTGTYLPRATGAIWTTHGYLKTNRDTVRRFIRAIARATEIIHKDGRTTIDTIQKYLGLYDRTESKALWHSVRDIYSPDIPAPLLKSIFADRHQRLKQKGVWPRGKNPPPAERFVARRLLTGTLKTMRNSFETVDVSTRPH